MCCEGSNVAKYELFAESEISMHSCSIGSGCWLNMSNPLHWELGEMEGVEPCRAILLWYCKEVLSEDQECLNTMHRARLLHVDRLDYLGTESCRTCWCVQNPLCRRIVCASCHCCARCFFAFTHQVMGFMRRSKHWNASTVFFEKHVPCTNHRQNVERPYTGVERPVRGVDSPLVDKPLAAGKRFPSKTNHQTLPTLILPLTKKGPPSPDLTRMSRTD